LKNWKKILRYSLIKAHISPQWLSQTYSTATPLELSNSSETKITLYTGPYRSSVGFLSPNSSIFLGSDAIACYSSDKTSSRFI